MMRLLGYWPADFIFAFGVAAMFGVLWFLHLTGRISLVECVTATDRAGKVRTDQVKLVGFCTWYVLTLGFVYIVVQDKLTEYYVTAYIGGAALNKYLRDREKRLNAPPKVDNPGP